MAELSDLTDPEMQELLDFCGKGIEFICRKKGIDKVLFALILFDGRIGQYVGNVVREDAQYAFASTAARLKDGDLMERVPFPKDELIERLIMSFKKDVEKGIVNQISGSTYRLLAELLERE